MQWQVNLLLSKWMKELEKILYGNIVAFDAALLPEAKQDELQNVIWRWDILQPCLTKSLWKKVYSLGYVLW